jgi:hypothetical protein
MEMIENGHIKNWTPVIGQTCQAWNRLKLRQSGNYKVDWQEPYKQNSEVIGHIYLLKN